MLHAAPQRDLLQPGEPNVRGRPAQGLHRPRQLELHGHALHYGDARNQHGAAGVQGQRARSRQLHRHDRQLEDGCELRQAAPIGLLVPGARRGREPVHGRRHVAGGVEAPAGQVQSWRGRAEDGELEACAADRDCEQGLQVHQGLRRSQEGCARDLPHLGDGVPRADARRARRPRRHDPSAEDFQEYGGRDEEKARPPSLP
mmetsp:Transcript_4527/g.9708  ORF Transcript_4527/g.9708 Transcript_4527/m.9708 type:complete len:201 (-) Transcript_4527:5683-6285(-)